MRKIVVHNKSTKNLYNRNTSFNIPWKLDKDSVLLLSIFLLLSGTVSAQDKDDLGTEVVNIVKPYTPTISDAFKVKETPILNDSISITKKKVSYSIFSVPVASTFTPSKGKAAKVEKVKPVKLFDNYATLGFGNYTNIMAELYSNFEISRTDNVGFFFKHNSSQGGIDGVLVDDSFYDTGLDANYTSRQRDASYRLDAGIEHQIYNWYGINDNIQLLSNEELVNLDTKQQYLSGYIGGGISIEDSYFEKASANIRYLGDYYGSSEFNISVKPEFSFPISDVALKVDLDLDYLSGSFDRSYFSNEGLKYSIFNAGVIPSIGYIRNDLTLRMGAAMYLGLSTDNENSNIDIFIYPHITASYRLVDELLIAYGGLEGGLEQNTYYGFKEINPFVSPTLMIAPTDKMYEGFAGLKGKLSNSVGYNVRAAYENEGNKALFQLNEYRDFQTRTRGYEQGNSFNVVYDDVKTLSIFGELNVAVSNTFSLGVNGTFNSYSTSQQMEAWNLPSIEASLFSNFNITKELYGGVTVFYVGERKDLFSSGSAFGPTQITLDGYVDANVHLGYRLDDQLSFFVKGSNLFGDNYEKWANFQVQGVQVLAGATYKFDW
jgi:hypothetical protein